MNRGICRAMANHFCHALVQNQTNAQKNMQLEITGAFIKFRKLLKFAIQWNMFVMMPGLLLLQKTVRGTNCG